MSFKITEKEKRREKNLIIQLILLAFYGLKFANLLKVSKKSSVIK